MAMKIPLQGRGYRASVEPRVIRILRDLESMLGPIGRYGTAFVPAMGGSGETWWLCAMEHCCSAHSAHHFASPVAVDHSVRPHPGDFPLPPAGVGHTEYAQQSNLDRTGPGADLFPDAASWNSDPSVSRCALRERADQRHGSD